MPRMRRLGWLPVAALVVAAGTSAAPALAAAGTTLDATVTTTAHQTLKYAWTLDKTASPTSLDMFTGDTKSVQYTVTAARDQGTRAGWMDGQVCVTNGGAADTQDLTITADVTMPPDTAVIASSLVDLSSEPVIPAGASKCYDYHVDIPSSSVTTDDTYKVTADVTITNHSGHIGTPFGPNPAATDIMPAATPVHDSLNVTDTNGQSWTFVGSGQQTYSKTFSCDSDSGSQQNRVTSAYTDDQTAGPSASAAVTVNCYALAVSKTVNTSLTRTYAWKITKSADQSSLTLAVGQAFNVNYAIAVTATSADSNWAAAGQITVHNPAPIDATINRVTDAFGSVNGTVTCLVSFPYTLAAGRDLVCSYALSLPDASGGTNTATATLKNTPSGTTDFTGTKAVGFSDATINPVDASATVSDSFTGPYVGTDPGLPATVNVGDAPKTFTYTRQVGPYTSPGSYAVDNTATVVASDTKTTSSSSVSIPVTVPSNGCTLTIGYWKTHPDATAKWLPITLGTPGGAKSVVVTSAAQATSILNFNGDASNGINKLDGQLLAAKLSIATGADNSVVASTISAADAFLATHNSADWSLLTKTQKAQVLAWATTLDNYNNGLTGPGHCTQ